MLTDVSLDDKYSKESGRIFVTGIQALVRLPMLQSSIDSANGLNTAGYISGYRGSPLGGYDLQLWQANNHLDAHDIVFQPGINEDLAATAIWGTQQAEIDGFGKFDGVFSIWYGKGPGVDRSGDAFRHANLAGTSKFGGVLAAMGDDHACESSTTAHQSEFALVDAMIPILNPSSVQDIMDFGLWGWALSRYSGCWVGLKCVHDTVEASASIELHAGTPKFNLPKDIILPPDGLNIRWPDTPLQQEQRLHEHKLPAVQAFWRANSLDKLVFEAPGDRIGIVTTGKSYSDVRRALTELNLDDRAARHYGLRLYKVALSWPLEREGLNRFAKGLHKILVVEEKRGLLEDQIKTLLYGRANAPVVIGKFDQQGRILLPSTARLGAMQIANVIGQQLLEHIHSESMQKQVERVQRLSEKKAELSPMQRMPYFCAGCPHNISTKVPQGSIALAGIGCHYMAQWMDRSTARFTQMGAEGASWIGESKFSRREHVFQNIGDGTYLHSGLLAIRAAVSADTQITFKLLYNDAVAMTGGQPFDAPLSVPQLVRQLLAEGVREVTIVTDDVEKYRSNNTSIEGVDVVDRHELDALQKRFRELSGVTAIVYDQTCAAEKRRRRKRNEYPDPPKRAFINTAVCEGCGDCGVQSNCVAILPWETDLGRKRKIDQSACNKDYSCLDGFCPSFVTVHGGQPSKPSKHGDLKQFDWSTLPDPITPEIDKEFSIVITGVGGTGVITVSAILGMAAHLAELGCSVLDMTGLAQKGGAVVSNVILAQKPAEISSTHVANGGAGLLLGIDLVVSASEKVLLTASERNTHAIVNDYEMMSGDFTRMSDLKFPAAKFKAIIERAVGKENVIFINANHYAEKLFGDTIAANMFMVGVAIQKGVLPIPYDAVVKAIELNGRSVEMNLLALNRGREYVVDCNRLNREIEQALHSGNVETNRSPMSLDELIHHRSQLLTDYQDTAYAARYRDFVVAAREAEKKYAAGMTGYAVGVARYYYKLLAYKDEYEVARLFSSSEFQKELEQQFEGDYQLEFHLAPPILSKRDEHSSLPVKRSYGPWMLKAMKLLARMKFLRGSVFDPFARSADRKFERTLIAEYESIIQEVSEGLTVDNYRIAVDLACYPEYIRGFGHVKQSHYIETRQQVEDLLAAFRQDHTKCEAA